MATTSLETLVDQTISVITNDGRNIVGILKGFDQATNLILDESHERVYSTKAGVEQLVLGLYIIRGDNIAVVGELDEELDASLDFDQVVVEFKAKWCGSCRLMAPSFAELSRKHLQLLFVTIDVDEVPDIAAQWDLRGLPTFVLIKDKREVDRMIGASKEELEKRLMFHVQPPAPPPSSSSSSKKKR